MNLFKLIAFIFSTTVLAQEENKSAPKPKEESKQKKEFKEFSTDQYLKEGLEDQDTDIEVVQNKLYSKKYNIELYGYYGLNPTNSFESIKSYAGGLGFHFNDYIGLQALYINNNNEDSLLNQRFKKNYGISPEYNSEQDIWAYQAQITPLYAKLAFFNQKLMHYEIFVSPTYAQIGTSAGKRNGWGFSGGNRFYVTNWFNLRMEYLSLWYDDTITFQNGSRAGQTVTDKIYSGTILLGASFLIGF